MNNLSTREPFELGAVTQMDVMRKIRLAEADVSNDQRVITTMGVLRDLQKRSEMGLRDEFIKAAIPAALAAQGARRVGWQEEVAFDACSVADAVLAQRLKT